MQTHNTLELIHPTMKAELLTGVKNFQAAVKTFYDDYDKRYNYICNYVEYWYVCIGRILCECFTSEYLNTILTCIYSKKKLILGI